MIDLDVDAGANAIVQLLEHYKTGQLERGVAAQQLMTFLGEAAQGMDLTADEDKRVEVYVMTLLRWIETDELNPDEAASDLCDMRELAEANDPEFLDLLDTDAE